MTTIAELIDAAYYLSSLGLSPGTTGNVSCKIDGRIYLSASGATLGTLREDQLTIIVGESMTGPKPTIEVPLHLKFYELNPDASAVIHLHSPAASAYSCVKPWREYSAFPTLSPYLVMKVGNVPSVDYQPPGSPTQADSLADVGVPRAYEDVLRTTVSAVHLTTSGESYLELQLDDGLPIQLSTTAASALAANLQAAVGRIRRCEGGGQ